MYRCQHLVTARYSSWCPSSSISALKTIILNAWRSKLTFIVFCSIHCSCKCMRLMVSIFRVEFQMGLTPTFSKFKMSCFLLIVHYSWLVDFSVNNFSQLFYWGLWHKAPYIHCCWYPHHVWLASAVHIISVESNNPRVCWCAGSSVTNAADALTVECRKRG